MIDYYLVPGWAARYCGLAYRLATGGKPAEFRLTALMPQLQLVAAGQVTQQLGFAAERVNNRVSLLGATHMSTMVRVAPHSVIYGVSLLPAGWLGAVGESAHLLADQLIEAGSIWGDGAVASLVAEAEPIVPPHAIVTALLSFIAHSAEKTPARVDAREQIFVRWLARAGEANIDVLMRDLDLSAKQTGRVSAQLFGASPKHLHLKYRALRLAALAAEDPALSGPAATAVIDSFYDQAHLIHSFKRFTGLTPGQFRATQGIAAREMLQLRWRAGARSPLTLWS